MTSALSPCHFLFTHRNFHENIPQFGTWAHPGINTKSAATIKVSQPIELEYSVIEKAAADYFTAIFFTFLP